VVNRRQFLKLSSIAGAQLWNRRGFAFDPADYSLTIAPTSLEVASHRFIKTTAYNQQSPGRLLRMKEGVPVTIEVANQSNDDEIVHWHGLFLPSAIDGAMEEGTVRASARSHRRCFDSPPQS